jgi:AcrR family transcriptional regulator
VTARETARIRILAAAERLFAETGIEAASLRQIAAAAGQRNTSAVAYHFGGADEHGPGGTKAALVAAVYERRMTPVNARRLERLAGLVDAGQASDVAELVRALVEPMAETLADAEAGGEPSWYLRFIAETMRLPEFDPAVVTAERPEGESIRELITLLAKSPAAQGVPADVFVERMRLLAILVVTSLADRERRIQDPDRRETMPQVGTEVLVNAGAAILSAPWPKPSRK